MKREVHATKFLLALLPAVALYGCADDGDGDAEGGSCVGAKCDDVDPASFACKDLKNGSGRSSANVLEELHDPFAELALKRGSAGCPTTFNDVMARLRETDTEGCSTTTHLVSEVEAQAPSGSFRSATSRRCNGRQGFELILSSFGLSQSRIPSSVELMAFDAETKEYNYYAAENNSVIFFGSSTDILKGTAGRCKDCHTGGGLVMKELRNPWQNWEGFSQTARALVDAHQNDLGSMGAGSAMESLTKSGNTAWNATKLAKLSNSDGGFEVRDLLEPLFCGDEFNLDTAGTSSNGSFRELPQGFFAHCKMFGNGCTSTHFGESGGVPIDDAIYKAAITDAGQTFPGPGTPDTFFAMAYLEPAMADIDFIDQAIAAGVFDDDFVLDVLSVDLTRPVFSQARCDLLQFVPEWDDLASAPDPMPSTTGGDSGSGMGDSGPGDDSGGDSAGGSPDETGGGSADAGDCCEDRSGAAAPGGCENGEIESCVCEADAFCCDSSWDGTCAQLAVDSCGAVCPRSGTLDAGRRVTGAVATAQALRNAFIAKLQAGGVSASDGTPAGALLGALLTEGDQTAHQDRTKAFIDACKARDQRQMIDEALAFVTVQRNIANEHHVMEPSVSAKVPNTTLSPAPSVHFDPATCELVE